MGLNQGLNYSGREAAGRFLPKVGYLLIVCLIALTAAANAAGLRLDADKDKGEPRSFRLMTDAWQRNFTGDAPSRKGMDKLNLSASGQPSLLGFKFIGEKIRNAHPEVKDIYIVDLRQESHGYANDLPVSLHTKNNQVNYGKAQSTVEKDEAAWLDSLKGRTLTFVPMGGTDPKLFGKQTAFIKECSVEEQASEAAGMKYKRFATADGRWPTPDTVDRFLEFVNGLPEGAWLHLHCHAGHGRTTSFAVMYDRLKNPDVDLETIAKRQYLLNGTDLLAKVEGNGFWAKAARERTKMLRLFDRYVEALQRGQTTLTWSEWLKSLEAK